MEATDPHHTTHAVAAPLAIGSVTISNVVAWGQSMDLGMVTSAITGIGGAVLGILWGYYSKVVPARTKAEADRDLARSASLAGRLDKLNDSLALAQERMEAEKELALAAKERADQLHEMVQDLRDQVAKGNAKTIAVNEKLHATIKLLTNAESRAMDAEMDLKEVLDQVRHNADLTEEARAKILASVEDEAHRTTDTVAEKADQVVAKVAEMVHPPGA